MKSLQKEKSTSRKSPISKWAGRFSEDYWFYGGEWLHGLILNFVAIPWNIITLAPTRVAQWGQHFTTGTRDSAGWLRSPQTNPLGAAGLWVMRLLAKTLDLFSFGEIINALGMAIKFNTRSLTEAEIREARKVFGTSIEYVLVRVDEWSLIADIGNWVYEQRAGKSSPGMALTLFNTILFSRTLDSKNSNFDMAWLIHELTHVAQYQRIGSQFIPEALLAQRGEGYDYGGADSLRGRSFANFNREQQGEIVKHAYQLQLGERDASPEQTREYARVLAQMRAGKM